MCTHCVNCGYAEVVHAWSRARREALPNVEFRKLAPRDCNTFTVPSHEAPKELEAAVVAVIQRLSAAA